MKFTQSHEWVVLDGKIATVGITNFAQEQLGEIVYVELPELEKEVKQGGEVCVLESTKAASDVYSPLSGQIVEVNHTLKQDTGKINQSAEKEGWLFKIKLSNLTEYDQLLTEKEYTDLLG